MKQTIFDDFSQGFQQMSNSIYSVQLNLLKQYDLTPDQFNILNLIGHHKISTSSKIAQLTNVKKSSVTSIINKLVDKGNLTRSTSDKDRRTIYLNLTNQGELKLNQARQTLITEVSPALESLSDNQLKELFNSLNSINNNMQNIKENIISNEKDN
ncbi:MarR family winged helix-turn-helix transcriptional regulator [Staphylococcus xylosus]|uniref:MarR family winged helix-turn-helix transcriptional regulator n=1 Tax=Staphylococcus xylosus TaxID=1288 RepID=UPI002DB87FEC|nr:MarR family transcriptional regulator [Staphylococcus xylosus]MEB7720452.1 MarR family transcriptional regulator [Staphylococcus xylosus]